MRGWSQNGLLKNQRVLNSRDPYGPTNPVLLNTAAPQNHRTVLKNTNTPTLSQTQQQKQNLRVGPGRWTLFQSSLRGPHGYPELRTPDLSHFVKEAATARRGEAPQFTSSLTLKQHLAQELYRISSGLPGTTNPAGR